MQQTLPLWCRKCGEKLEEKREENGVVRWTCACSRQQGLIDYVHSRAFKRNETSDVPFNADCNLRISVNTPGVLQNMLASSVHLTPRYAIEQIRAAGIGYERQVGRAHFVETHVNTVFSFFEQHKEESRANHLAKTSNANLRRRPK
jgi:hypothetical protein